MIEAIYRSISFHDLNTAGYRVFISENNDKSVSFQYATKDGSEITSEEFFKALNYLGLVTNTLLKIADCCEHVTLSGKRVVDYRFIGLERDDLKWLGSGSASEEVKLRCKPKRRGSNG